MPSGELPVADGDAVVPVINRLLQRFDHAFATQDWHPPGHASFASAHPGRAAVRHDRNAVRHPGAVARPRHRRHTIRRDPSRHRPDQDRGNHSQGLPSSPRQLLGVLRERPADVDRPGSLAPPARLFPHLPVRPRHRFLRRLVRRGCRARSASPSPSSRTPAAASAFPPPTAAPRCTPPMTGYPR